MMLSANWRILRNPIATASLFGLLTVCIHVSTLGNEFVVAPPNTYLGPRVSPDGERLAYALGSTTRSDIYVREASGARLVLRPLADDETYPARVLEIP